LTSVEVFRVCGVETIAVCGAQQMLLLFVFLCTTAAHPLSRHPCIAMPPPSAGDIRHFLSPARGDPNGRPAVPAVVQNNGRPAVPAVVQNIQPSPVRRRRVVHDSDLDSDNGQAAPIQVQPPVNRNGVVAAPHDDHIVVASSSEGDDDMWVRPQRAQPDPVRASVRRHQVTADRHREPPARNIRARRRLHEVEAEEVDVDTDNQSLDETDENAADLYRSAMLGVRNRPNAMHQTRTSSTPCPACAHFGKFIAYFL